MTNYVSLNKLENSRMSGVIMHIEEKLPLWICVHLHTRQTWHLHKTLLNFLFFIELAKKS